MQVLGFDHTRHDDVSSLYVVEAHRYNCQLTNVSLQLRFSMVSLLPTGWLAERDASRLQTIVSDSWGVTIDQVVLEINIAVTGGNISRIVRLELAAAQVELAADDVAAICQSLEQVGVTSCDDCAGIYDTRESLTSTNVTPNVINKIHQCLNRKRVIKAPRHPEYEYSNEARRWPREASVC